MAGLSGLEGRTALVTGGARRIGREIGLALAGAGVRLVIHCHESVAEAERTRDAARALGVEAAIVTGDLADGQAPARILAEAAEALGAPDILVNNAAVFENGRWEHTHAVNLRAPLLLSRAFAARLPAGRGGDIVMLGDTRALRPGADHVAYTTSKVGLHGLVRSLALELAPRIAVNEVALGAVLSPETEPGGYRRVAREDIPLGRFPRPADVAEAVLFLVRNESVTGQTVRVDGGCHLR